MLEQEWYDGIRNGWTPLCDRCNDNINRDNFYDNRNQRGVYCEKCWNWIHIKKWVCSECKATGTIRSDRKLVLKHCKEEVIWSS